MIVFYCAITSLKYKILLYPIWIPLKCFIDKGFANKYDDIELFSITNTMVSTLSGFDWYIYVQCVTGEATVFNLYLEVFPRINMSALSFNM